jgi:hypothetical protein
VAIRFYFLSETFLAPTFWEPEQPLNCTKFYVNCSALTGTYDWQYKYLFACLYANHLS